MKIRPYTEADAEKWDEAVGRSAAGTFLHTRRFLFYHGHRFTDRSLICEDEKNRLIGIFPAALKPGESGCVSSHPGATYGGLVCCHRETPGEVEEMLARIIGHYRSQGLKRLEYKSIPPHFHYSPRQADLHAIWKQGGEIVRRDLWNVLPLRDRPAYSKGHKWAVGRARKSGIMIRTASAEKAYRAFHVVLEARLAERYGASPVHAPEEMLALRKRFPDGIALWLAQDDQERVLAGSWIFMFAKKAWHAQYIASTQEARERCASHLLFDCIIRKAEENGVMFFSFGSSTEENGRRLNSGLFQFKAGFGAGIVCHDVYGLRLA